MVRAFTGMLRVLGVLLLLVAAGLAWAQERPWLRLFGPRGDNKTAAARPAATDPRRLAEIQVEIAWLADPATFPYYLEARAVSSGLEVRGYVPSKAIHEHALNLARVYSTLPVVDAVKEHPSLQVKQGQMAPQQLHNAVSSALREALPRAAQGLHVQVTATGQVTVTGNVPSHDERLQVSHALRRLFGCSSVQNLTQVPGDVTAPPRGVDAVAKTPPLKARTPEPQRAAPTAAVKPEPRQELQATAASRTKPAAAETKEPPAPTTPAPTVTTTPAPAATTTTTAATTTPAPTVTTTPVTPPATPAPAATPALAAKLRKKIEASCPGVKGVRIDVVSPTEYKIEVTAATEEQVGTFAGAILMLPELQEYKADLTFKVMP
jgi:hypothetical protein